MIDEEEEITQSQIYTIVTSYVLSEMGFQVATESIFSQLLNKLHPKGSSHFRDALAQGCNLLIKLSQLL